MRTVLTQLDETGVRALVRAIEKEIEEMQQVAAKTTYYDEETWAQEVAHQLRAEKAEIIKAQDRR